MICCAVRFRDGTLGLYHVSGVDDFEQARRFLTAELGAARVRTVLVGVPK